MFLLIAVFALIGLANGQDGTYIGVLEDKQNYGITGDVYILNSKTIKVKNFVYNGGAPDLYFWGSRTSNFGNGFKLSSSSYRNSPLGVHNGQDVVVKLPEGVKIGDVKRFGLWCEDVGVDFGNIPVPQTQTSSSSDCEPTVLGRFSGNYNLNSGNIDIIDDYIIKINSFSFAAADHSVPDAFFYVGRGNNIHQGIAVPFDGTQSKARRRRRANKIRININRKNVYLNIKGSGMKTSEIGFISVYCKAFTLDFGHVKLRSCQK